MISVANCDAAFLLVAATRVTSCNSTCLTIPSLVPTLSDSQAFLEKNATDHAQQSKYVNKTPLTEASVGGVKHLGWTWLGIRNGDMWRQISKAIQ